jgi:pimeloyl-ACP methyl ester carboxylesterase
MATMTTFAGAPIDIKEDTSNKSGYATINGINMYYQIHGKGGLPLVLIHGGGSTIETSFGSVLPQLSREGKVVAVELQAHGRTSDRDQEETFEQDADDVAALLKYLKIEKANFLGFSNGGNTAMQIGIRHPETVNKLVIASAVYKREGMIPGFFEGMLQANLDNMPAQLKEAYLKVAPDKKGLEPMHDKDKNRMLNFKDWKDDDLRSIKAKTLLLAADHDVVTPEHTIHMYHLIPNAQLMILPGTHGSYLGEVCSAVPNSKIPEMTVNMIEEFLRDK